MSFSPNQASNGPSSPPSPPRARPFERIVVFSHPRTMSNLFLRFFAQHPQVGIIDYPFDAAYMAGPERQLRRSNPQIDALVQARTAADHRVTYQMAYDTMRMRMRAIEAENKMPLIKQPICDVVDPIIIARNIPSTTIPTGRHPSITDPEFPSHPVDPALPPNPTMLPAAMMDSVLPIVLIRHPALMIPSFYRIASRIHGAQVDDAEFPIHATLRWSRLVLDYYLARNTTARPIVIDASTLVSPNTETLMAEVCRIAGLDSRCLQYQWRKPVEEQMGGISEGTRMFREAFLGSTGVLQRGKGATQVSVDEEMRGWMQEFGAGVAEGILRFVEGAMPDWEYLKGFALKVDWIT